jgi:hypothetical protein
MPQRPLQGVREITPRAKSLFRGPRGRLDDRSKKLKFGFRRQCRPPDDALVKALLVFVPDRGVRYRMPKDQQPDKGDTEDNDGIDDHGGRGY